MADQSVQAVQESLRSIGITEKDGDFNARTLKAVNQLREFLTNDKTPITAYTPEVGAKLQDAITQFMTTDDYKKPRNIIDGGIQISKNPLAGKTSFDNVENGAAVRTYYQFRCGGLTPEAAFEKFMASDLVASQAPASKASFFAKPDNIRSNMPAVLNVLENSKQFFGNLNTAYAPTKAPEVEVAKTALQPAESPKAEAPKTEVPVVAVDPVKPNPVIEIVNNSSPPTSSPPSVKADFVQVTGQTVGNSPANVEKPSVSETATTTGSNPPPVNKELEVGLAIRTVEGALSLISGKLNAQAAKMEDMMGVRFSVEEPGSVGGNFEKSSQLSLQSVLWALRGPRALDIPKNADDPDDELWSYSPAVGAEVKRKLPRLLAKMDEKDRKSFTELYGDGTDFVKALDKLHGEGLLGEKRQLAQNPVQIDGWLKGIVGAILPMLLGVLTKIMPNSNVREMVDGFLGEKIGVSLADLMPEAPKNRPGGNQQALAKAPDAPKTPVVAKTEVAVKPEEVVKTPEQLELEAETAALEAAAAEAEAARAETAPAKNKGIGQVGPGVLSVAFDDAGRMMAINTHPSIYGGPVNTKLQEILENKGGIEDWDGDKRSSAVPAPGLSVSQPV